MPTTPKKDRINRFFSSRLNAPVKNPRWSWGASDDSTNTVFLRLWRDNFGDIDGREAVQVFDPNAPKKPSRTREMSESERLEHIERARHGARLIGVICTSREEGEAATRNLKDYDDKSFAELNGFAERNGATWAFVERWIGAEEIDRRPATWSDIANDVDAIRRDGRLLATKRQQLIEARLGQGRFRSDLLRLWGNRCALTGCAFDPLLRASHVKPWRSSDNEERLDPLNGLPLVAHVDALFDRGFITFSDEGHLMVSARLPEDARVLLGTHAALIKPLSDRQRAYLAHHRAEIFR
ncbi:HNH endonuclease [Burkholderia gladioli]|uniref:HNH endonuclease n=1 Tax=Burkholderia gladioli TaxID=28095 RepID=UPI00163E661E|nr:HNH endonuclease [Burkholderia gladioli]